MTGGTPSSGEELFDVVDELDRVVDTLPRSVVHARNLMHRACHVFVVNSRGELLVHRRSETKDQFPSLWSTSASGHVSAGESYDLAASRETFEEIGLKGPLELLGKFPPSPETTNEHVCVYRMISDEEPTFDPAEIQDARYLPLAEIKSWLERSPGEFTPSFTLLFDWYLKRSASASG